VGGSNNYCLPCLAKNEPAIDNNHDNIADYGECCEGPHVFRSPFGGGPVCSECRTDLEDCNRDEDCCGFDNQSPSFCIDNRCSGPPK
jgi:hypothetical protein